MNISAFRSGIGTVRPCITVVCVLLLFLKVSAEDKTPAYLPLLERNSIARKVLDVTYLHTSEIIEDGKTYSSTKEVHLVFDAESGHYREETKTPYDNLSDKDKYLFSVVLWNGKESLVREGYISKKPGSRALGQGVYENPGSATISGRSRYIMPFFAEMFFDATAHTPFEKTILDLEPRLDSFAGNTITIVSGRNKFEFSKKSGAIERLTFYEYDWGGDKPYVWRTYDLSDHVELSGIWIPCTIILTANEGPRDDKFVYKAEFTVDPKTLRLRDKVNDSLFTKSLPAGCIVNDQIRKKAYVVTTVDTLPNDVEAVKQALEKMLEQAQEQKAAVEQKK